MVYTKNQREKGKLYTLYTAPTKTAISILLFMLMMMITNLACLQTAIPAQTAQKIKTNPTSTKTAMLQQDTEPESGEVFDTIIWTTTPKPRICYRVTAMEALNLRVEPEIKATAIAWLTHDQIVTYIATVQNGWYQIAVGARIGYANSTYLERTDCP